MIHVLMLDLSPMKSVRVDPSTRTARVDPGVTLGESEHTPGGDTVKCAGLIVGVPVGPELIGRVVNALGQPIDGKGPVNAKMTDVIEKVAPGVIARQSVSQPGEPFCLMWPPIAARASSASAAVGLSPSFTSLERWRSSLSCTSEKT